ncbi:MAG TPA: magnesium transporter [Dokdonella sp.]|uniref:magnesium transporter n=1 Tax=Dokdonella sp. TaxID=2291710 RepID=UPI0025B89101|nr:magnesium transporter [Dokdonella sp.]MBX3692596.1 magnesium transporter [Dokdonella sp.]MCW5569032.1 magnesium transporter [Dokdonella sp.]HNR92803.1 magnesium transporter [Dokdonella sp.]
MHDRTMLSDELRDMDADAAARRLATLADGEIGDVLLALGPGRALAILDRFSPDRRTRIAAATSDDYEQWHENRNWPEGSVGRIMEPVPVTFVADARVADVLERLRPMATRTLMTYVFVVAGEGKLAGVVTFREMVFATPDARLDEIMVARPFSLQPDTALVDAMREVVHRHYPVYPVCNAEGCLIGVVRGAVLFAEQAFEISAQAGSMVGVEKEERLTTSWPRSLRFRHPWLQLNLIATFITATVVGLFQDTINQIVLLAVFLPVLSDQCNNTGCQALAVTLRGMMFGELKRGQGWRLLAKECWLGLANGSLTGFVGGLAMYLLARFQGNPDAPTLALITWAAMAGSCGLAGVVGAGVPQILRRLGADPATASSIFLTKATDVVSLAMFLGLAAWLLAR